MQVIHARNVNTALASALFALNERGEVRSSRNGTVLAFPTAVSTVYTHPTERVLFSPMRNANPCFHLTESLWMLAGRDDVAFPATIVKNMKSFTDDGKTFWGAYGYRWRDFFGWDQIDYAIRELNANPESRRVVLSMWNAFDGTVHTVSGNRKYTADFIKGQQGGKDVPCNTQIYFDTRGGRLNMLVCCRSNDILWGCYGANAVHMSVLQEYVALSVGLPVGTYTQMSNDLHLYNAKMPEQGLMALAHDALAHNLYGTLRPMPLWNIEESRDEFDEDMMSFFHAFDRDGYSATFSTQYETDFFNLTVARMMQAWAYRKTPTAALEVAAKIEAPDWRAAMIQWITTNHVSFGGAK